MGFRLAHRASPSRALQVVVILRRQLGSRSLGELALLPDPVLLRHERPGIWRRNRRRLLELELLVAGQLAREPQEGLLKVVVGLGRDVKVREVLLAVEGDLLCLHLSVLHIDLQRAAARTREVSTQHGTSRGLSRLVSDKHNGDIVDDTNEISVPVRDALVCDAGRHVKHDDGTV